MHPSGRCAADGTSARCSWVTRRETCFVWRHVLTVFFFPLLGLSVCSVRHHIALDRAQLRQQCRMNAFKRARVLLTHSRVSLPPCFFLFCPPSVRLFRPAAQGAKERRAAAHGLAFPLSTLYRVYRKGQPEPLPHGEAQSVHHAEHHGVQPGLRAAGSEDIQHIFAQGVADAMRVGSSE